MNSSSSTVVGTASHVVWSLGPLCLAGFALVSVACSSSADCESYLPTSIASLRTARGSGCVELQHVLVIARTPSTETPRVYLQDLGGGDFSAIVAKCDATSTRACSAEVAASVHAAIDGEVVTARGFYQQGSITGFEELYLDGFTRERALAEVPPPVVLAPDEATRDARARAKWFRVATIAVSDPWVVYDFSPTELERPGPCPGGGGFAMIPLSAGTPPPAGCTVENGSSVSPPSVPTPDSREILIGREFYEGFYDRTDCECAGAQTAHLLCNDATVKGTVGGVLVLQTRPGSSQGYQLFHPLSKSLFPVTCSPRP